MKISVFRLRKARDVRAGISGFADGLPLLGGGGFRMRGLCRGRAGGAWHDRGRRCDDGSRGLRGFLGGGAGCLRRRATAGGEQAGAGKGTSGEQKVQFTHVWFTHVWFTHGGSLIAVAGGRGDRLFGGRHVAHGRLLGGGCGAVRGGTCRVAVGGFG